MPGSLHFPANVPVSSKFVDALAIQPAAVLVQESAQAEPFNVASDQPAMPPGIVADKFSLAARFKLGKTLPGVYVGLDHDALRYCFGEWTDASANATRAFT